MTNDVEECSIVNNNLNPHIAKKINEKGLPRLLDIYSKYDVRGTFYFTGTFAARYPESVQNVFDHGHEVGCHGYHHGKENGFDVLSSKNQFLHLTKAKKIIEDIVGEIEAFRAPALRIGNNTVKILEKLGFKTDSSISPQRFDGPLTFGSFRKLRWLTAPRHPYRLDYGNPFIAGKSNVLEVPLSSMLFSYQGTTMRFSPQINALLGNYLYKESKKTNKPIVFLFHPTEIVMESKSDRINQRSNNYLENLFAERIRGKIKLRNLGKSSGKLLESVLKKAITEGHKFVSVSDIRRLKSNNL